MKYKHLIRGLMTIALACGVTSALADGFELVNGPEYELYDGVGFMKEGQCMVYTREFLYEDANYDYHYNYTFYDKEFNVCASLSDIKSDNLIDCDQVLGHNNLITEVDHGALFTQTFFNEDDDIEYVEIAKSADKATLKVKQVISGNVIATLDFKFPENVTEISVSPYNFLDMAGKHYIEFCVSYAVGDDWNDSMQIYRVNGGGNGNGSGLFTLVSERKVKVYPNPVNQGDMFNVQLPTGEDGVVAIFDINGKYVKAVEFKEGKASIGTDDMPKGMYLYNAQSEGKTIAKNKLIVK